MFYFFVFFNKSGDFSGFFPGRGDNKMMLCKQKSQPLVNSWLPFCGPDGARTRDPMRDRHVF